MRSLTIRITGALAIVCFCSVCIGSAQTGTFFDSTTAKKVVKSVDIERFKADIKALSDLGDRKAGSSSNAIGQKWIQTALENIGYKVSVQFPYKNVYCTKSGSISPDSMYIISAHYDGQGQGGAADDDGSGVALVLASARALAAPGIKTRYSVRFLLFNNEETGLQGSKSYRSERESLQGKEDPPGSHLYPEPVWLGLVQHDMVLYDHGVPPKPDQAANADINVEYKEGSKAAKKSHELAKSLSAACTFFGTKYPVRIGPNMSNTDSDPFKDLIAAVSVREAERLSEIGRGSNPYYHTANDVYKNYSEKDFALGWATVQMTLGTVCLLAGVYDSIPTPITPPDMERKDIHTPARCIRLFTLQGKRVAEFHGNFSRHHCRRVLAGAQAASHGLYIVEIVTASDGTPYRFPEIIY